MTKQQIFGHKPD